MDSNTFSAIISWALVVLAATTFLVLRSWTRNQRLKLPPGPPSWPVVGGLFYIQPIGLHRAFAILSKKYGPIFHIRFGAHPVIVVSSPTLAKVLLLQKGAEFGSRPCQSIFRTAATYLGWNQEDVAFADYSPHLKFMRKIVATEMFTGSKLNASEKIRGDEIAFMLQSIAESSREGETVGIRHTAHKLVSNIMSQVLFARRLYTAGKALPDQWKSFPRLVSEVGPIFDQRNMADVHPVLGWLSSKSVLHAYQNWHKEVHRILSGIVAHHRKMLRLGGKKPDGDFVYRMLAYQEKNPGMLSDMNIMGMCSDVLVAANDATSMSLEWVMLALVRRPDCMAKLRDEIDSVVGRERLIGESDVAKMPYLQRVVKETLRMHTPVPLLLPHSNIAPQSLGGYNIPTNSVVILNTHAICRDPSIWKNPDTFDPDRFAENGLDFRGRHFEFTPFGSGPRQCLGMAMGLSILHRAVASLVQAFDWSPRPGTTVAEISDEEVTRSTNISCKHPLVLSASPRLPSSLYAI